MAYLKPQAPLMSGADYIYPVTTSDQVVMGDGNRLNAVGVYLQHPDEGESTDVTGNNADTLGGIAASDYALKTDFNRMLKRNLLDNSDFEIAQAGYGGAHGNKQFACDRWERYATTAVAMTDNGLSISFAAGSTRTYEAVWQYLGNEVPNLTGKYLTLAASVNGVVYCGDGLVEGNNTLAIHCGNSNLVFKYSTSQKYAQFEIYNNASATVQWLALYEGKYTIDNLPPYVPKGYAAELAECQRYYKRFHELGTAINCWGTDKSQGAITVPFHSGMNNAPSISEFSAVVCNDASGNAVSLSGQSVLSYNKGGSVVRIRLTNSTNWVKGNGVFVGTIALSSDP